MRVLVTGGAGQLGTRVLERLLEEQAVEAVRCLDVRPPVVTSPKLSFASESILDAELKRELADADAVVHLAFMLFQRGKRELSERVNIEGSRRVFEAAAASAKVLVNVSSIAAYGLRPGLPLLTEELPCEVAGVVPYSDQKARVEHILDEVEAAHPALRVVRLRPGLLLGTRIQHMFGDGLRRRFAISFGDVPAPVVWDEDVADAVWLALQSEVRGAFNLTADGVVGAQDFEAAGFRCVELPAKIPDVYAKAHPLLVRWGLEEQLLDPGWLRAAQIPMRASAERARRELGWAPSCPTGVAVIERYMRDAPNRLDRRLQVLLRLAVARARPVAGVSAAQVCLLGPGGGDLVLRATSAALRLEVGLARPPDASVRCRAETLLRLLAGRRQLAAAKRSGDLHLDTKGEELLTSLIAATAAARQVTDWLPL